MHKLLATNTNIVTPITTISYSTYLGTTPTIRTTTLGKIEYPSGSIFVGELDAQNQAGGFGILLKHDSFSVGYMSGITIPGPAVEFTSEKEEFIGLIPSLLKIDDQSSTLTGETQNNDVVTGFGVLSNPNGYTYAGFFEDNGRNGFGFETDNKTCRLAIRQNNLFYGVEWSASSQSYGLDSSTNFQPFSESLS